MYKIKELEYILSEEFNLLIKRLAVLLITAFIFYGLLYLYEGLNHLALWHVSCATILFFLVKFLLKDKSNKLMVVLSYLIVCIDILMIITVGGHQIGMDLFYIPLMLSIPLFFDFFKEKYFAIASFTIIILSLIIGFILSELFYDEFSHRLYNVFFSKYFLIINITIVFLSTGIIIYSFYNRHYINNRHWSILRDKSIKLNEVTQKLGTLTDLSELVDLAKNKNQGFYQKFILAYPDLITKIHRLCPNICRTELEFCAYLKLNFSTKQIAIYTNSTVKSVESKKYRIRKKFNLSSDLDIYVWINSL